MYRRILVAIENSAGGRTILTHVVELATLTGASLLLVHVADGWAARHFDELTAARVRGDEGRPRLPRPAAGELASAGPHRGNAARDGRPGHRADLAEDAGRRPDRHVHARPPLLADVLHGATADRVRHLVKVPVLLLRAQ